MTLKEEKMEIEAKQLAARLERLNDVGRLVVKAYIDGYGGGFSAAASAGNSETAQG